MSYNTDERSILLEYFKFKDTDIYNILNENITNLGFPFINISELILYYPDNINLLGFIYSSIALNKFKPLLEYDTSKSYSKRGKKFINKIIEENTIFYTINSLILSVYVSNEIINRNIEDIDLFIKSNDYCKYIIVDTANLYYGIKQYIGNNIVINKLQEIINNKSLNTCIYEMIDFIIDNCSYINYKYLFITPTNHNLLNDDYIIISSGCEEYIGSKCSKENLTNEVDDCLTLMVYDYIKYHKNENCSILSQDNYDFSFITQDISFPIERSFFDIDGNIIAYNTFIDKYPDIDPDTKKLSLFVENYIDTKF